MKLNWLKFLKRSWPLSTAVVYEWTLFLDSSSFEDEFYVHGTLLQLVQLKCYCIRYMLKVSHILLLWFSRSSWKLFFPVYFHGLIKGKSLKKNGEQRPNKKGKDKLGNNEANAQGKKLKCQKCKKRHVGECLFGKKVCFKCKQPGHIARDCASIKKEKLEKEGKAQGFAST